MDLSNKYLQLPKELVDSFYEDANKVFIGGKLTASEFENEFKRTIRAQPLSGEKAVYLSMQVIPRPLPSIQDTLMRFS